jgi:hypothetical protein
MSMADPLEMPEVEVREGPPLKLINVDDGPQEVSELKVQERPPSMLRNVGGEPLRGAIA